MALNKRSRLITHGDARSPNRAMLRAVGFGDTDFEKPIVGVANGHSNMNPCNAGIQPLVDRAMAALREIGAMLSVLGGVDALIFTAGVGENSPQVRKRVCERLAFLGLKIDPSLNTMDHDIATSDSKVRVLIIHANEELQIAKECYRTTHQWR